MCGRYAASRSPRTSSLEFEAVRAEGQRPLPADYNVAPTKDVYVVRHKKERDAEGAPTGGGHRELRAVRWGLVPSWAKDVSVGNRMLNARVESLTDKPAFRKAAALPALPGPGRRLVRVGQAAGLARPSSRTSSPRRTARCWPSPGSGRCGAAARTGSTPAPS